MLAIVRMDSQGRILIPAKIRRKIKSKTFILELRNGEILLKPINDIKLTSLFDKIEINVNDFTDTHKLRPTS